MKPTVGSKGGVVLLEATGLTPAPTSTTRPLMREARGWAKWTVALDQTLAFVATVTIWGTVSDPDGSSFVWFKLGTLDNTSTSPLFVNFPLTGIYAQVSAYTSGTVRVVGFASLF